MRRFAIALLLVSGFARADFISDDSSPPMPAEKTDIATCTANSLRCAWTYNALRSVWLARKPYIANWETRIAHLEDPDLAGASPYSGPGWATGGVTLPAPMGGRSCANPATCLDASSYNGLLAAVTDLGPYGADIETRIAALEAGSVDGGSSIGYPTDFLQGNTPGGQPIPAAKTANVTACPGAIGTCMDRDAFNAVRAAGIDVRAHLVSLRSRIAAVEATFGVVPGGGGGGGGGGESYTPTHYVDCSAGSGSGTQGSPWNSLSAVNGHAFSAGDVVAFRTGTTCSGELDPDNSGSSGARIVYTSYDPVTYLSPGAGAKPVLSYSGDHNAQVTGNYVTFDGLKIQGSSRESVLVTGSYFTSRNCELTDVGYGFELDGDHATVTGAYVHDLTKMIVNTSGGSDDYGAVCFAVQAPDVEIAYSRCINARAPSNDYGHDGGCLELYSEGGSTSRHKFHHNWCEGTMGFFESTGTSADDVIAYNVIYNCYGDLAGTIQSTMTNLLFENNTIVGITGSDPERNVVIWMAGGASSSSMVYRNNIFTYASGEAVVISGRSGNFTHDHNIYWDGSGGHGGLTLGTAESAVDPRFTSSSNFRLQASSPAVNAGVTAPYSTDYDGQAVPTGSSPDMGAFEFH